MEDTENTSQNTQKHDRKKSSKIIWIVLAVLLVLGILTGAGYWYLNKRAKDAAEKSKKSFQKELDELRNQLSNTPTPEPSSTSQPTSTCSSTLTDSDNLAIATWSTYTNNKYNYSFKYPENWVISEDQDDFVSLTDDEASINFQFRSDAMSAIGYESYKVDSELDVEVACIDTVKTSLSGNTDLDPESANDRMIFTLFTKDGIPHLVMMTYQYIGASISSDVVEAYDLILKTIKFE